MATNGSTTAAGISSDAVRAKTGKTWDEWFAILDRAGAAEWPHKEIAIYLHDQCDCGDWWSQMVTVGYEQARGLRVKHQKCDGGFSASASKTIGVPVGALFDAWNNPKVLAKWLPDGKTLVIRKTTPNKSLRITWIDGTTNVDVNLVAKGDAKSQVAIEHQKLASVAEVTRFKAFWAAALVKLQALLEAAPATGAGARRRRPSRRRSSRPGAAFPVPARASARTREPDRRG